VRTPVVLIVGRELERAVGIRTPGYGSGHLYCDAVTRAGGVPLVLPPIVDLVESVSEVLDRVDGLVLHGGGDIDPSRYDATTRDANLYGVNSAHDDVEIAVTRAAIERDLPVLAICRGMQVLNIVRGGTLIQHIEAGDHRDVFHPVSASAGSLLSRAMGTSRPAACHSFHHQAIERLGSNLVVTATSDDGIIEAVELLDHRWVIGVQWHPEDTAAQDAEQQLLFDEFVRACATNERAPGTGA
jgi:putative glutamine amidotransferase